jgi:predicted ferric reductase
MLTNARTRQRLWPVGLSVGLTLALWLGSKWFYQDWFADPFKYPAKAASLTAVVLMAWCLVLSARLRPLERFFGGLDQVYQMHKRLGRWALWVILLHPLFLAADRLPSPAGFLQDLWFRAPGGDRYLWGQNLGVAALLLLAGLLALTLWARPAYHIWKRSHEWLGLMWLAAAAHVWAVRADVAAYPLLTVWVWALLAAGGAAFVYIRFLYRRWGPAHAYRITHFMRHGDILELVLHPDGAKMDFRPSQFVYLVPHKKGVRPEPHPYSIACGYNLEAGIKLGIKMVGDHTRSLDRLAQGDAVTLYGPYGHFSDRFLEASADCVFVAGGIGITPFLGMWHVALHSEDRRHGRELPGPLQRLHPEIMRTWHSPLVHLFYVCRRPEEASFDKDIKQEVIISQFHGFRHLRQRGHSYELYLSSEQGRFSADYLDRRVPGGLGGKWVFLCGPPAMTGALRRQLRDLGVPEDRVVEEDFNLL